MISKRVIGVAALCIGFCVIAFTSTSSPNLEIALAAVLLLALGASITAHRFQLISVPTGPLAWEMALLPLSLALRVERYRDVMLLLLVLLVITLRIRPLTARRPPYLLYTLIAVIFVPLIIRPYHFNQFTTTVLALILIFLASRRRTFDVMIASLVDGIGLYLIANVAGNLIGLQSPDVGVRTGGLDSSFGGQKIFYPFSTGVGFPPIMAAMFVAASLLLFERSAGRKTYRLLSLTAALAVLVGADARASLGIAAVLFVATVVTPKSLSVLAPITSAICLVFAFIYDSIQSGLLSPVLSFATSVFPFLSRGSDTTSSDLSLDGRDIIWRNAISFWHTNAGASHMVLGWGTSGQAASGAYSSYTLQVAGLSADPRVISVHNSGLQELYDGGLLGFVALSAIVLWGMIALVRRIVTGDRFALVGLSMCLAATLAGATEVNMAPGFSQESLWVFLAIVVSTISTSQPSNRKGVSSQCRNKARPGLKLSI